MTYNPMACFCLSSRGWY